MTDEKQRKKFLFEERTTCKKVARNYRISAVDGPKELLEASFEVEFGSIPLMKTKSKQHFAIGKEVREVSAS